MNKVDTFKSEYNKFVKSSYGFPEISKVEKKGRDVYIYLNDFYYDEEVEEFTDQFLKPLKRKTGIEAQYRVIDMDKPTVVFRESLKGVKDGETSFLESNQTAKDFVLSNYDAPW